MTTPDRILVKNACVVDPAQGFDREVMDLHVQAGKLVESLTGPANLELDVHQQLVMAGAIDLHAHVLAPMVAHANLLNKAPSEAGPSLSVPVVGEQYLKTGYTTLVEASLPPTGASHAHLNARGLPGLDVAFLLDLGSSWLTPFDLHEGNADKVATLFGHYLALCKGYGVAATMPYETERWTPHVDFLDKLALDKNVPHFELALEEAYAGLVESVQALGLPHPVHVTPHYPEGPKAFEFCSQVVEAVESAGKTDAARPTLHLATASVYSTSGEGDAITLHSRELVDALNARPFVEWDLGLFSFHAPRVVATRDRYARRRFEPGYPTLHQSYEMEVDWDVGYRAVRPDRPTDVAKWTGGLEVALLAEDLTRVQFTVNHPNYGSIWDVPGLLTLLASAPARAAVLEARGVQLPPSAVLGSLDREYSLADLCQVTRVSPARALGCANRGSLQAGAIADLVVYPVNPADLDPSRDHARLQEALAAPSHVMKRGRLVFKEGQYRAPGSGHVLWTTGHLDPEKVPAMKKVKEKYYDKFFSLNWDSITVHPHARLETVRVGTGGGDA